MPSLASWSVYTNGAVPTHSIATSTVIEGNASLQITSTGTGRILLRRITTDQLSGAVITQFRINGAVANDVAFGCFAMLQAENATSNAYWALVHAGSLNQIRLTKTTPGGTALATLNLGETIAIDTTYAIGLFWSTSNLISAVFGSQPDITTPIGYVLDRKIDFSDVTSPLTTSVGAGVGFEKIGVASPASSVSFDVSNFYVFDSDYLTPSTSIRSETWDIFPVDPTFVSLRNETWDGTFNSIGSLLRSETWD